MQEVDSCNPKQCAEVLPLVLLCGLKLLCDSAHCAMHVCMVMLPHSVLPSVVLTFGLEMQIGDRHSNPGAASGVHAGSLPVEPGEAGLQLPSAAGA